MTQTNPQIEAQLDELATICCELMKGESTDASERFGPIVKALLMSGYKWKADGALQSEIESRVKAKCGESASHRGGALSSLSNQIVAKFKDTALWESKTPENDSPPKSANISSATGA